MKPAPVIPNARKNLRVAAVAGSVAVGMVGLAYASVPLYSMFCKATGFGGTTQRADVAPETATGKFITIRFDANTAGSLGWNFHPVQSVMKVKIGEQNMAHYSATNTSRQGVDGQCHFQCDARRGRRLLQQDSVLLLHRANLEARRERRFARGFLCRSGNSGRPGFKVDQRNHAVLHIFSSR